MSYFTSPCIGEKSGMGKNTYEVISLTFSPSQASFFLFHYFVFLFPYDEGIHEVFESIRQIPLVAPAKRLHDTPC